MLKITPTLFLLFRIVFIILTITINISCKKKKIHTERAAYFWKNSLNDLLSSSKLQEEYKIKKIYVKYFEVDCNTLQGCYPYSKISSSDYYGGNEKYESKIKFKIIPTIFIKSSALKNCSLSTLDTLANNILFLVKKYSKEKFESKGFIIENEIQLDYDWTASTKDNYFTLLKKLKVVSKGQISCTMRLYPFKYPEKMGIPPVDRATLMCYNMVNFKESHQKNTIFDLAEFKKYFDKEYSATPYNLDIAFPLYNQTLIFREGKLAHLYKIDKKTITDYIKSIPNSNLYEVLEYNSDYNYDEDDNLIKLHKGDKIKFDNVNSKDLLEALKIIKEKINFKNSDVRLTFFDLNKNNFNKYSDETIDSLYTALNK